MTLGSPMGRSPRRISLLARTPEEHLRRAATIATNGANDAASRLLVIEHLLWAARKGPTQRRSATT